MNHLSEDRIVQWITGEKDRETQQHLLACPACAAEIDRTLSALRSFRLSGYAAAAHWQTAPPSVRRFAWRTPVLAAAAAVLISVTVSQRRIPQPQPEVFMPIPYVVPPAPYERTAVVRMEVPAAALMAAGLDVRSPADSSLPADVLVGQDGRALAVSLVSDSGGANP
jgi:hypothetical protein